MMYYFYLFRLLVIEYVRRRTEVRDSSYTNGYKYPATYPHKPEDTSTYSSAHEANIKHGRYTLYIHCRNAVYVDVLTSQTLCCSR